MFFAAFSLWSPPKRPLPQAFCPRDGLIFGAISTISNSKTLKLIALNLIPNLTILLTLFWSLRDAAGGGSHSINRFCLDIEYSNLGLAYHLSFPNVVEWINIVVQPRLKHLCLHLHVDDFPVDLTDDDYDLDNVGDGYLPKLPISIFTCKTLVSLDLYRFSVKGFSFSSIEFGFPSLKTLRLSDIPSLKIEILPCFYLDVQFLRILNYSV